MNPEEVPERYIQTLKHYLYNSIICTVLLFVISEFEYTKDSLLKFKDDLQRREAAEKQAQAGGEGFGGFGGFGGGGGEEQQQEEKDREEGSSVRKYNNIIIIIIINGGKYYICNLMCEANTVTEFLHHNIHTSVTWLNLA